MTVNNIFIPSFKCQKNQYHILPDNNKLINESLTVTALSLIDSFNSSSNSNI